jgi:putative ABC transport system substrate-binding protein
MRRREFIVGLGGAAAMPRMTLAQERVRRVGVLMNTAADHPQGKSRLAIFRQTLLDLGWISGRNIRVETRGAVGIMDNYRKYAAELVAFDPDVVLAFTTTAVIELQRASRTIPIVFTQVMIRWVPV